MQTMYPAKVNSPTTMLAGGIDAAVDIIPLFDSSVLPAAPNLAAIGTGEDTETILYEVINGNNLETVTRGFQGVAKSWPSGTQVARFITAYDHDAFKANIETHDTKLGGIEDGATADQTKADIDALGLSHDLLADVSADDHHIKFENLVEDITPQLGGDLDGEGHKIHDQVAPYVTKTVHYTTTVDDEIIGVHTGFLYGLVTITLGSATCRAGQIIMIKDEGGNSEGFAITIATEGAETIDGAATDTINSDRFSKQYYSDGSNWYSYSLTDDHRVYGLLQLGTFANLPVFGTNGRLYYASDTKQLWRDNGFAWGEMLRGETATRLAQLAEKAHANLTGVGADDHHAKYTDAEAKAQAEAAKLDDHAAPDDNTDLDATVAKHGLMPKADKTKLGGIEANADVTDATNVEAAGAIMHSLATAASDFLVASGSGVIVKKTLAETAAILEAILDHGNLQGLGDDDHPQYALDTDLSTHAALSLGAHGIPADPGADRYLMWDDDPGELVWATPTGGGDVVGPAAAIDNAIVRFDGVTGKLIQDYTSNPPTISDTGDITVDGDLFADNIGIGTAAPSSRLHVTQDQTTMADDTPLVYLETSGGATAKRASLLHLYTTRGPGVDDTDLFKIHNSGGSTFLTVRNTGKVGIGDTAPNQLLGIKGTTAQISIEESDTRFVRIGVEATADDMCLGWDDSDDMHFGTFASPTDTTIITRMIIQYDGKVGIGPGALTPASILEIDGGVNIGSTGAVADNNLYVQNDCSALSFTDRTAFYKGDAIKEIKGIKADAKGELDHSTLPPFARGQVTLGILDEKTGERIGETVEEGLILGNAILMLTVAVQQLTERIEALEKN